MLWSWWVKFVYRSGHTEGLKTIHVQPCAWRWWIDARESITHGPVMNLTPIKAFTTKLAAWPLAQGKRRWPHQTTRGISKWVQSEYNGNIFRVFHSFYTTLFSLLTAKPCKLLIFIFHRIDDGNSVYRTVFEMSLTWFVLAAFSLLGCSTLSFSRTKTVSSCSLLCTSQPFITT